MRRPSPGYTRAVAAKARATGNLEAEKRNVPASSPLRAWRPSCPPATLAVVLAAVLVLLPWSAAAENGSETTPVAQTASPAALADILEDEQARQQLIEALRRMAAEREPAPDAASPPTAEPSLPERLATGTQAALEQLVQEFELAVAALAALGEGRGIDPEAVAAAAGELLALALATVLVYLLLRRVARLLYARANAWVMRAGGSAALLRRAAAAVALAMVDGATVLLAWAAGWALALSVAGPTAGIDPHLSLFLNAFLAVEGFKLLLRVVFATRDAALRLLPVGDEEAAYWYAWLAHLASFVGYGVLLVVPVLATNVGPAIGRLAYVIVLALGFVYGLAIILQNRARVRQRLEAVSRNARSGGSRMAAAVLARIWHLAAIAYLAALTGVLLRRPDEALAFMAAATLQSLLAIALGALAAGVIGRAISHGIRIPETTRARFPLLEERLNAFVPRGLQGIRLVLVVLVAALVLDAWRVFDLGAWLRSDAGIATVASVASVLAILMLAAAAWIVVASWIDFRLRPDNGLSEPSARHRTLLALFRNAAAVVIVTMAGMITLSELGIDIGPLIAGAGVLGLAIGFGAQKLVQDIIGGVFIQLENAINTGDWIDAGGISGTAERLSIRSVGLRDLAGTFHIVPFSSVDTVSNYMRDFAYHVGVYGVAYRENTDEVIPHLIAAFEELLQDPELGPEIIGDLEISGVTGFGDSSVNIRVRIKTKPGLQWRVGRGYNRLVKQHFDAADIEIPFPHTTLYFGRDKNGHAPAANVQLEHRSVPEPEG